MRYLLIAALALVTLPGTVSAQSFVSPSGQQAHTVKCSGSPNGCYQKATETCQGSYQVFDSESHAGGLLADIFPGPVTWYSISFSCGKSDGRMPTFAFRGQQYRPPAIVVQPRSLPTTTYCNLYGRSIYCNSY